MTRSTVPWIPIVLVLSAFGPYITSSLRLEHVVLYPLSVVSLFVLLITRRFHLGIMAVALLLLISCFWIASSTLLDGRPRDVAVLFAALDNLLQPIAVLLVVMALPAAHKTLRAMETVMICLIVALCWNTLGIFVQMATGFGALFGPWIPEDDVAGSTVWSRSLELGRYCGIFAQPIEAGAMYSLGVLSCLYLAVARRRVVLWTFLALLCAVGGVLSVSKIIVLVGLPIAVLYLLSERHGRWVATRPWFVVTVVAATVAGLTVLLNWRGLEYLTRLFTPRPGENLLDLYTSGRFGSETDVVQKFTTVWQQAPWTGLGMFAFPVVDNGFLDIFAQGGLIGGGVLISVLLLLIVLLWVHRRRFQARWLLFVLLFALLASMGGPVLTMNRFEIVFWLLVAYICLNLTERRPKTGPVI